MTSVKRRRCDVCLCVESPVDPRTPWYRLGFTNEKYGSITADVCGGCRVKPVTTIEHTVLDNIEDNAIQDVTHTVFTRDM